MILLLDNFDSFTYNLLDYFNQLGEQCIVVRSDVSLNQIQSLSFDKIVFSPGPSRANAVPLMQEILLHYHKHLPILGVCLGHQAIGEFFKWKTIKAIKPMHGKLSEIKLAKDPIFEGIGEKSVVTRYHSLILESSNENNELKIIAWDELNQIMAIKHTLLPIWGIQFHPEAHLTKDGLKIIKNWIEINNDLN